MFPVQLSCFVGRAQLNLKFFEENKVLYMYLNVGSLLMSAKVSHLFILTRCSVQLKSSILGPYMSEEHLNKTFAVHFDVVKAFQNRCTETCYIQQSASRSSWLFEHIC